MVKKMKIFVSMPQGYTRDTFLSLQVRERLSELAEVSYNDKGRHLTPDEFAECVKDKDVVITGWGQKTIVPENLGSLKLIVHTGGAVGGIVDLRVFDTDVKVISGNRYYAESVVEGVIGYMLFELRKLDYFSSELKKGVWLEDEKAYTEGLFDQSVGIISVGEISRLLMKFLKQFRVKMKVYSTSRDEELAKEIGFDYADLEEIFSTCKIVSVHTAKNPQTYHMINKKHFEMMRDDGIFINTSRGDVIDEDALIDELKKGRFRALLDVYKTEPLPADSPLLKLDNVSVFPHQAGPTIDRRAVITNYLIDDIKTFFDGKGVLNEIEKDVAARMTKR